MGKIVYDKKVYRLRHKTKELTLVLREAGELLDRKIDVNNEKGQWQDTMGNVYNKGDPGMLVLLREIDICLKDDVYDKSHKTDKGCSTAWRRFETLRKIECSFYKLWRLVSTGISHPIFSFLRNFYS